MPAGGAPFNNEDLYELFQAEIWAVLEAQLIKYRTDLYGVIVSGCDLVANGGGFDITAGVVYINGEFMRLDAQTGVTFVKYIVAGTPTNVTRQFNDGGTKNFIVEKKAVLGTGIPGGGLQYITIASLTGPNFRRLANLTVNRMEATHFNAGISTNGTDVLQTTVLEIGDWDMDTNATRTIDLPIFMNPETFRCISGIVRSDDISPMPPAAQYPNGEHWSIGEIANSGPLQRITLSRVAAGACDNASFNSTGYNRGWLVITHV
jgi:hypothetical protein